MPNCQCWEGYTELSVQIGAIAVKLYWCPTTLSSHEACPYIQCSFERRHVSLLLFPLQASLCSQQGLVTVHLLCSAALVCSSSRHASTVFDTAIVAATGPYKGEVLLTSVQPEVHPCISSAKP